MKNFELIEDQLINGDLVLSTAVIAHSSLIDHTNPIEQHLSSCMLIWAELFLARFLAFKVHPLPKNLVQPHNDQSAPNSLQHSNCHQQSKICT